jgi:hypothetical protein
MVEPDRFAGRALGSRGAGHEWRVAPWYIHWSRGDVAVPDGAPPQRLSPAPLAGHKNSGPTHKLESLFADEQWRKRYKTLDFIKILFLESSITLPVFL